MNSLSNHSTNFMQYDHNDEIHLESLSKAKSIKGILVIYGM